MADTKAKASGPLWAAVDGDNDLVASCTEVSEACGRNIPCRILPGHGEWVPAELVEDIEDALKEIDFDCDGTVYGLPKLESVIRAAREGKV